MGSIRGNTVFRMITIGLNFPTSAITVFFVLLAVSSTKATIQDEKNTMNAQGTADLLAICRSQNDQLHNVNNECKRKADELTLKISEFDVLAKQFNKSSSRLEEKDNEQQQEINELRRVVESLAAQISEYRNETLSALDKQNEKQEEKINQLQSQIEHLKAYIKNELARFEKMSCQRDWIYFGGFCYWADNSKKVSHDVAKSKCQQLNSNLVSIHSEAENAFVASLVPSGIHQWIRLGLTLNGDTWEWSDGSKVNYTKWESGEPNHLYNEKWVYIHASTQQWRNWPELNWGSTAYTVCKKLAQN